LKEREEKQLRLTRDKKTAEGEKKGRGPENARGIPTLRQKKDCVVPYLLRYPVQEEKRGEISPKNEKKMS